MKKIYVVITKKFRDAQQQRSYYFADIITIEESMDLKWLLIGTEIINATAFTSKRKAKALVKNLNRKWAEDGRLAGEKRMNKYYGTAA